MNEPVDVVALVAERKIREAMEEGLFDGLPGAGRPLPEDDLAGLPDETRLALRILRGAGYVQGQAPAQRQAPDSAQGREQVPAQGQSCGRSDPAALMRDFAAQAPDEARLRRRLLSLRRRLGGRRRRPEEPDEERVAALEDSPYLAQVIDKLGR
ncbi:MAG: DUF1992 domain-containing protein [Deltaproteobacteria bacterium]|jgi:hypothetical protein|nr:DUF1992 domain-containing protein [Deltaproteobacteria bacterium]